MPKIGNASIAGDFNMPKESVSRRGFISGIAAAGSAATLARAAQALEPGDAVVLHSFPIVEPKPSDGRIKIVCAEKLTPEEADKMRSAGKNIDLVLLRDRSELKDNVADAEVILGVVDRESMQKAGKLKWVQTWAAGVETLPRELMEHPCVLTNMQRVFAPVIAESALGMMLGLARGLVQVSIPAFKEHRWDRSDVPLADLYQKTLGLVGLGGIGTETARRAHYGFSMKVLAMDPKPLPKPEFVAEMREPGWLMEMVPQADVLMSAAPLTKETRHMFNEAVFRKMKRTAYFINMSRVGRVVEWLLRRARTAGWIRGAG